MRCGDENSKTNKKIREAAFNIIRTVGGAFLHNSPSIGFEVSLPNEYSLEVSQGRGEYLAVTVKSFRSSYPICWWWIDKGKVVLNDMQLPSLADAMIIATDIHHGWLNLVFCPLGAWRGEDAVTKLRKELGMLLEVSAS